MKKVVMVIAQDDFRDEELLEPKEILERNEITRALLDRLTQQEVVVIEWLSQGLTLNQIATILRVSRNRTRQLINHIVAVRRQIEER